MLEVEHHSESNLASSILIALAHLTLSLEPGGALGINPDPDGTATIIEAALSPAAGPSALDEVPIAAEGGTCAMTPAEAAVADQEADGDADSDGDGDGDGAASTTEVAAGQTPGLRYTADISDEDLAARWKNDPSSLGSISVGLAEAGRLINGEIPEGDGLRAMQPENCYATQETVHYLQAAAKQLAEQYPDGQPIRINHISAKDGGYLRPHQSHQTGRDVDIGFFYPNDQMCTRRDREHYLDPKHNWAMLKAIITQTDVQFILSDRRVQKVIYNYALKSGEDKAWLDSLFHAGPSSLFQHAPRHRDHFHVRFYNPRAQELGRRVQPMLAEQPEHNMAMHRVRRGDTLGRIASIYGSSVKALLRANHLTKTTLKIGITLSVPLRGPCTHCPLPPEVIVPPRRLPPAKVASASTSTSTSASSTSRSSSGGAARTQAHLAR